MAGDVSTLLRFDFTPKVEIRQKSAPLLDGFTSVDEIVLNYNREARQRLPPRPDRGGDGEANPPRNCISHSLTLSICTALRSDRSSYSSLRASFSRQNVARPLEASRPAKIP